MKMLSMVEAVRKAILAHDPNEAEGMDQQAVARLARYFVLNGYQADDLKDSVESVYFGYDILKMGV